MMDIGYPKCCEMLTYNVVECEYKCSKMSYNVNLNVVKCWKSGCPNVVKCYPKMLWNVNTNVRKLRS